MRMPLWQTLILFLLLDRFHWPGIWTGALGLLLAFAWAIWIRCQINDREITLEDLERFFHHNDNESE